MPTNRATGLRRWRNDAGQTVGHRCVNYGIARVHRLVGNRGRRVTLICGADLSRQSPLIDVYAQRTTMLNVHADLSG